MTPQTWHPLAAFAHLANRTQKPSHVRVLVGPAPIRRPCPPYPKASPRIKKKHRPWNDIVRLNINKIFI